MLCFYSLFPFLHTTGVSCPGGASIVGMLSGLSAFMFLLFLVFTLLFLKAKVHDDDNENNNEEKERKKGWLTSKSDALMAMERKMETAAKKGEMGVLQEMEKEAEEVKKKMFDKNKKEESKVDEKPAPKKQKKTKKESIEASRGSTAARRFVGDQMVLGRVSDSTGGNGSFRTDYQVAMDRIKIFYGWAQIFSALSVSFEIAWPIQLREFSLSMGIINLDIGNLLSESACQFAVPYLDKMVVHLIVPIWVLLMILCARIPAHCLKKKKHRPKQEGLMIKLIASFALILYPGLCTRLFSSLKTVQVPGLATATHSGRVLAVDYSVEAFGKEHMPFVFLALAGFGVYVVGVPLCVLMALRCNRKYLYTEGTTEKSKKKHEQVVNSFGTLYLQCEFCLFLFGVGLVHFNLFF